MNRNRLRWEWYVFLVCCVFALLSAYTRPRGAPAYSRGNDTFLPVIMYHSLLKDPSRANDYTISPATLESDLQYLLAEGYETVVIQDLISYVYQGVPLPEKPVMITFDDGHLNNLTYALPILQRYNARAVISVVGAYVEEAVRQNDPNPQYAYVTWEDIRAMAESGCFEVQNHSYNLHHTKGARGAVRKQGEVLAAYQERLSGDVLKMQKALYDLSGVSATAFTYPYGLIDQAGEHLLRDLGFMATLTCVERPNYISQSPDSLYLLGRYNRPAGISTYRFMQKALKR